MKPRKCPFCRCELVESDVRYNDIMNKWVLNHYCPKPNLEIASIFFVGDTEEEVREAWGYEDEESESL
jgi:hypothetical protein